MVSADSLNQATLLGCAALAAAVFWFLPSAPQAPAGAEIAPLTAFPTGAAFAATVDLTRLRQAQLGAVLTSAGREIPGLGPISNICGFDPTEQVDRLAVAVHAQPPAAQTPDGVEFGVVAAGRFDATRLAECASAVIRARGGTPARTRLGSFLAVRDRDHAAGGEIAVRQGGPVLLGAGTYLRRMVDAVEGRAQSMTRDSLHAALRRSIGADGAMVASWVLPPGWLEQATGSALVRLSPLSGVRAAALRLDVSPAVQIRLVVGCTSPAACQQIAEGIAQLRRSAPTLSPPGTLGRMAADRIEVVALPNEVRLTLSLSQTEAAALLEQLLGALNAASSPAPAGTTRLPTPDEVIRPER